MFKKIEMNNLLFISFFTIFFHLIPFGVETQPHFTLFFSIISLFFFNNERWKLPSDVVLLFSLIFILFVYTVFQLISDFSFSIVIEFIKYLLGPVLYLALRNTYFSISFKLFYRLIFVLVLFAILNLILPTFYDFIFGNIIPRFSGNIPGGIRGITILTPEPSYFAIFQIILLMIIEKHFACNIISEIDRRRVYVLKYLVLVLCLLTKSAYVLILCLIFIMPSNFDFKKSIKIFFLAVTVILLLSNIYFENRLSQIIVLISALIKEDSFDLFSFLFTQESSGGTRVILNFFAISSVWTNPLGSGLGSFSSMLSNYSDYYNIDLSNHEVLGNDLIDQIYPQTYFANLCNDIGIFAFFLLPVIFINNDNSNKGFNLKRNSCLLFMLLFQSQITNPAFWFLIAISKIPHDQKIFK